MGNVYEFIANTRTSQAASLTSGKAKPERGHRHNAKTTPEQVKQILELRERRGWSPARIATKTKIPVTTVTSVINGNGARTVA